MINKNEVTLGFDPEFMIWSEKDGRYVSGLEFQFGTKGEGEAICEGCEAENDNVTIEMVLDHVNLSDGLEEVWNNYAAGKAIIESRLPTGYHLACCSSCNFTDEEIAHPVAQTFGCSMDYNAWKDGEPNPKPTPEGNNRCAGGHTHIGFPGLSPKKAMDIVKLYDLYVTVPLVIMDPDTERRKLYGMAGSFRMTPQKVECRSSPNYIWSSFETLEWLFNQVGALIDYYNEHGIEDVEAQRELIIDTINTSNVENAYKLCEMFGINIPVEAE